MSDLYLRTDGHIEGPFTEGDVRQRLSTGELSRRTMSWRTGERRWVSLGRRWISKGIIDRVLTLLAAMIAVASFFLAMAVPGRLFLHLPMTLQTETFIDQSLIITLSVAIALTLIFLYLNYRRLHRATLSLAVCGVLALLCTPTSLALRHNQIDALHAEDKITNASINYDEQKREIHVNGEIGRQFSASVGNALRTYPYASVIVINSPGGLVHEAFHTAEEITSSGLPLRVDGECASACALLWASVPHREMTASSRIGVHQGRLLGDIATEFAGQNTPIEMQSKQALKDAGFPDDIEQRRETTPTNKMYWMDSVEILNAGVKARVVDTNGQTVDLATAKWLATAGRWRAGSTMNRLYLAIMQHEPSVENRYVNNLYESPHARNPAYFGTQEWSMVQAAKAKAFALAPDDAIMVWARGRQQDLAEAVNAGSEPMCQLMIGHTVVFGRSDGIAIDAATRQHIDERATDRLTALINAIPKDVDVSDTQVNSYQVLGDILDERQRLSSRLEHKGFPSDFNQWTKLQSCTYYSEYYHDAMMMPLTKGAAIVRYSQIAIPRQPPKAARAG